MENQVKLHIGLRERKHEGQDYSASEGRTKAKLGHQSSIRDCSPSSMDSASIRLATCAGALRAYCSVCQLFLNMKHLNSVKISILNTLVVLMVGLSTGQQKGTARLPIICSLAAAVADATAATARKSRFKVKDAIDERQACEAAASLSVG